MKKNLKNALMQNLSMYMKLVHTYDEKFTIFLQFSLKEYEGSKSKDILPLAIAMFDRNVYAFSLKLVNDSIFPCSFLIFKTPK